MVCRALVLLALTALFPGAGLAGQVCPPASLNEPLPGASEVSLSLADVSTAAYVGSWQQGVIGKDGLQYRLFADGTGSVASDLRMRGWHVDFTCDLSQNSCRYESHDGAPKTALAVAREIGDCLTASPPVPKARPAGLGKPKAKRDAAAQEPVDKAAPRVAVAKPGKATAKAPAASMAINHPLDCPICDQGGECQLQDLSVGYGGVESRYQEEKRVVGNKDLGPLVSTDMTRCINCTRCVRFTTEIAGLMELGQAFRGEHAEIMPSVEKTIDSELSGNIIDLCPVGALNSKPFRFGARAWEMWRRKSVSPHDSLGSNLVVQVKNDAVKRVLPLENEALNECWLSDAYAFKDVYMAGEHSLLASRDDNPMNGISTLDLVLIQKHIMGTELLNLHIK